MWVYFVFSHNAVSFNLDHIIILFHAFSDRSSGPLCPFIYLCFCPRKILIQSRQFYFDSYLYVKWERGLCHVIAPVLRYMLKRLFLYCCPRTVQTFCQWISWTSSHKKASSGSWLNPVWDDSFSLIYFLFFASFPSICIRYKIYSVFPDF